MGAPGWEHPLVPAAPCYRHTVQGQQRCHQNHLGPVEVTWGLTHLVTLGSRPANITIAPACCETLPAPLLRSREGRGQVMFPLPTLFNGQGSWCLAPGPCYPCQSRAGHLRVTAGGNARTAKRQQQKCWCSAGCHKPSCPDLLGSVVVSALTGNTKRREKKMQRAIYGISFSVIPLDSQHSFQGRLILVLEKPFHLSRKVVIHLSIH